MYRVNTSFNALRYPNGECMINNKIIFKMRSMKHEGIKKKKRTYKKTGNHYFTIYFEQG